MRSHASRMFLAAAGLVAAGCAPDLAPTGPSLAKGPPASSLSATPPSVEFGWPAGGSEVVTVTTQYLTTITSSTSNTGCATVSPASVPTKKPKASSTYVATFTVLATGPGTCTITLTDKNGKSTTVQVTVLPPLPDRIVYASNVNGAADIWIMDLDGQNKTPLTASPTEYDFHPILSSDGRKILFASGDNIATSFLMNVDGTGRTAVPLADMTYFPTLSPDSRRVVYGASVEGRSRIFTANLDGTNRIQLTFGTSAPSEAGPSWSGPLPGRIAFVREAPRNIWIMNADGTNQFQVSADDDPWFHAPPAVALSPDGLKIAFDCQPTAHVPDICIINADGTGKTQLTSAAGRNRNPRWTRDGRIVFTSDRDGNLEVYIMNADGTGLTNLTNSAASESTSNP